ncbi:MAG: copper-translocating P-type ATPase [Polyangiaceae bacterium]|nr:copper-translocating P-type ATPase [Polyangiaceae bacterium]
MSHGALPGADGTAGRWAQFALASAVVFGPARRFFVLAYRGLRHRVADMNALVALGSGSAWIYSSAALVAPWLFPHGASFSEAGHGAAGLAPAAHGLAPHLYFEAAAVTPAFVLVGKLLESRARGRLSDAVRGLVALRPKLARRLRGSVEEEVAADDLAPGDRVVVRPGERVATDGEIESGTSSIDESMLTGESLPADKAPGSLVFGGTLNGAGAFTFRATKVGADTALARIVEAVERAQGSRAPVARLADLVSARFVPVVLAVALATLTLWLIVDPSASGLAHALERFVAVLVIACPCALGLATPAAVAVGAGRGAELGILFKGGEALEAASRVDLVLLDKTGTLTAGEPSLTDVITPPTEVGGSKRPLSEKAATRHDAQSPALVGAWLPLRTNVPEGARPHRGASFESRFIGSSLPPTSVGGTPDAEKKLPPLTDAENELLALAASAEAPSEHPLARAVVEGARSRGLALSPAREFRAEAGAGIEALVGAERVLVGTASWLERAGVDPSPLEPEAERLASLGRTPFFVARFAAEPRVNAAPLLSAEPHLTAEPRLAGLVAVADRPADGARAVIATLLGMGLELAMATGDRERTARAIAAELGLERVHAGLTPLAKAALVAEARAAGRTVAMVGDGINDAPALAAAHVGIAAGHSADVAIAAADVALLRGGIASLPRALGLARATLKTIRQNLFWAFVYNVVGIPLAAGLLYPFTGWQLSPLVASAAMSLSSVSVLANSLRLRRYGRA